MCSPTAGVAVAGGALLAVLGGVALPSSASAAPILTVTNPLDGCAYSVSGPSATGGGDPGHPLPILEGGVGESVSCG